MSQVILYMVITAVGSVIAAAIDYYASKMR